MKTNTLLRWTSLTVLMMTLLSVHADVSPPAQQAGAPVRDGIFLNSDGSEIKKKLGDIFSWYLQRATDALLGNTVQAAVSPAFVSRKPDLALLISNKTKPTATWLGHATTWVQMGGLNIMTDPHFSERASPVQWFGYARRVKVPATVDELPAMDVVVISHNHYDHLDYQSVMDIHRKSGGKTLFLVPKALDQTLKGWGVTRVKGLDWWESVEVNGTRFYCVPAHHWSARSGLDRNETLWGGWVAKSADFSFYFAGDTGYSADFAEIGKTFGGFDLAAIPVGAYEPRWFMKEQHVNPAEAVQIHRDVNARLSIGIHWGTFEMTDEPLSAPLRDLPLAMQQAGLSEEQFLMLQPGETRMLGK